jgi:hypothetical protein
LALEDEEGLIDVVLRSEVYEASREPLKSPFEVVEGQLRPRGQAISVLARRVMAVDPSVSLRTGVETEQDRGQVGAGPFDSLRLLGTGSGQAGEGTRLATCESLATQVRVFRNQQADLTRLGQGAAKGTKWARRFGVWFDYGLAASYCKRAL